METDNWKDVFQELRDFSPVPPESVKAAIDQQLAAGATQTVGRSMKWIIFLSGFLLLVSIGIGIYFYSISEPSHSNKIAENTINSTNDLDETNELNTQKNKTANFVVVNSSLDSSKHSKTQASSNAKSESNTSKNLKLNNQKFDNQNKNQLIVPAKTLTSEKKNASVGTIKNDNSGKNSTLSKTVQLNSSKTTKVSTSKIGRSKKVDKNTKKKTEKARVQSSDEASLNSNDRKINEQSNGSLTSNQKTSDNNLLGSKTDKGLNEVRNTKSSAIDSNLLSDNIVKNESENVEQNKIDVSVNDKAKDESKDGKNNNFDDKKADKNFKNEFGLSVGPMLTSNKRSTNSPEIQLQSKVGFQLNATYGYKINDRFTLNAGISYQNYKEKLTQNSPAKTDSTVTSYVTVIIPNPVDTTLIDTIVTPVYTVQNIPAVNGSNEIQLNRFGLNTGLSFLVYENPTLKWSYSVRFGHQLYYSQSRMVQTDLSGYPVTVGKWNGAVYLDNYLSKNIGLLNVTLGVSSTYDYTRLTNWSGIEKKRLYFSPYLGFSMQF